MLMDSSLLHREILNLFHEGSRSQRCFKIERPSRWSGREDRVETFPRALTMDVLDDSRFARLLRVWIHLADFRCHTELYLYIVIQGELVWVRALSDGVYFFRALVIDVGAQ